MRNRRRIVLRGIILLYIQSQLPTFILAWLRRGSVSYGRTALFAVLFAVALWNLIDCARGGREVASGLPLWLSILAFLLSAFLLSIWLIGAWTSGVPSL